MSHANHSARFRSGTLAGSLKAREVEEVIDLYFYRPLGFLLAKALRHTRIRPNHVTMASILLGVGSGHLLFYPQVGLTWVGVVAFMVANLLDSVDGQLARLTQTQSRWGRILDGLAGGCMFSSIYLHLACRLYSAGDGVLVFIVAGTALYSQAVQNSIADCLLNAYLTLGLRHTRSELDDADDMRARSRASHTRSGRWGFWFYANYMATQEALTPALQRLRRAVTTDTNGQLAERLAPAYRQRMLPLVHQRAWLATNIRMGLLFLAIFTNTVVWFFWLTILGLNLVMALIIARHEHQCRILLHDAETFAGTLQRT